jgi:hypothetical protein
VAGVHYNDRSQAIYRCRHRGQGCAQPGRAANGLQRATVLGLRVLSHDQDLQSAIRNQLTAHRRAETPKGPSVTTVIASPVLGLRVLSHDQDLQSAIRNQLTAHRRAETPKGPSVTTVIASLEKKRRKVLDLHYADQIDAETFAEEHRRLTTQIKSLQKEAEDFEREQRIREEAVDKFDEVAALLDAMDVERIWDAATVSERRTLVEDLVDSVCLYPDRITVQVAGAPPFTVALDEVGLTQGCKPAVSEARREPQRWESQTVIPARGYGSSRLIRDCIADSSASPSRTSPRGRRSGSWPWLRPVQRV